MCIVLIRPAKDAADIAALTALWQEYAAWIAAAAADRFAPHDRAKFDEECRSLPGSYALPTGFLLLALEDSTAIGCVAVRALSASTCELKRLFVQPAWQGGGRGRQLALAAMDTARDLGYETMRLDTLSEFSAALRLYDSLGFVPIPAYHDYLLPGQVYREARLV